MFQITEARRESQKAIIGLIGSSGSGKTVSALLIAYGMMEEKYKDDETVDIWSKIGIVDTEHRRSMLYVDEEFNQIKIGSFKHIDLTPPFSTERYSGAIAALKNNGCEVVIVDSLSHQWQGEGGMIDKHSSMEGNSFQNWGKLSTETSDLIKTLTSNDIHILATMRTKTEYVVELNENGKMAPRKIGTKPVQKDDMEYEFMINFHIDMSHKARTLKDNTRLFEDKEGVLNNQAGRELYKWLELGVDVRAEREEQRQGKLKELTELVGDNETYNNMIIDFQNKTGKMVEDFPIEFLETAIKRIEEVANIRTD